MDLGSVTITAVVYRATSGKSTDPWSYQVDILVLSMDLTAGKTWDQLCNTKSDVLLTWVLTGHGPSTSLGCRDGPQGSDVVWPRRLERPQLVLSFAWGTPNLCPRIYS